jgi:hypothetical protein
MHHIKIDISKAQLHKLRKGHRVRVKHGTGFNLIVNPSTYSIITKSFKKNKGANIALDEEEIKANIDLSNQLDDDENNRNVVDDEDDDDMGLGRLYGSGIFGRDFDRSVENTIGRRNKKELYKTAEMYKVPLQVAMNAGIATGAAALTAVQPELAPFIAPAAYGAATYLTDYIEHPSKYQSRANVKDVRGLAKNVIQSKANEEINRRLGTNYDYMNRAGLDNLYSNEISAALSEEGFRRKSTSDLFGNPYMSGRGFSTSIQERQDKYMERAHQPIRIYGRGMNIHDGSGFEQVPAMRSQPFSANFQFQHTLPHPIMGGGLYPHGSGLYAGRGFRDGRPNYGNGLYA